MFTLTLNIYVIFSSSNILFNLLYTLPSASWIIFVLLTSTFFSFFTLTLKHSITFLLCPPHPASPSHPHSHLPTTRMRNRGVVQRGSLGHSSSHEDSSPHASPHPSPHPYSSSRTTVQQVRTTATWNGKMHSPGSIKLHYWINIFCRMYLLLTSCVRWCPSLLL